MTRTDHPTMALPRRARAVLGVMVLVAIGSGCSGAGARTTSTTKPHVTNSADTSDTSAGAVDDAGGTAASACDLLSEADVSTAMKQEMKTSGDAGMAICTYSATADPSVLLAVQGFANQAEMATYTQIEPSSEHLDGLGDSAFWNPTLDMVFVHKGDRAFAIVSPSLANLVGDPQGSKSAMVDLAKIVLTKF
jgi:hypothetical protein